MKISLTISLALALTAGAIHAQTPTSTQNHIVETVVRTAGQKTIAALNGLPVENANRTIGYFDGLGRSLQTVRWQGSPNKKDMVQPLAYDQFGREPKKYDLYAEQTGNDGSYRPAAIATQQQFYNSGSSWEPTVAKTDYPFALTTFEALPGGRPVEQGAAGQTWQPGGGHTVRLAYRANNLDQSYTTTGYAVRLFRAELVGGQGNEHLRTLSSPGFYGNNQLYLTITKDENWQPADGKIGTIEEYKDLDGRLVLKRLFNNKNGIEVASTYYVYDDFGKLSFVLPPGCNPDAGVPSQTSLDQYAYQYRYDGRMRMIEKRLPSRDNWDWMVYNRLDQLVFSQDPVQRSKAVPEWSFTKYDAVGRTIITGIVANNVTRANLQATLDGQTGQLWETRNNADVNIGYTNMALPSIGRNDCRIINYYDDYAFPGASSYSYAGAAASGLQTGSLVRVLGSTNFLLSLTYYDDDGRVAKTYKQHYLGGTVAQGNYDEVSNTYLFSGELASSERVHHANGANTSISNSFVYDHTGRLLQTLQNINGQGQVLLSRELSNELGQVKRRQLHNDLQATNLSYNERGWLKGSSSTEFSMELKYQDGSTPQYNGNISGQSYTNGSSNAFSYTYDRLNRLTQAVAGGNLGEAISYDLMGNISSLVRDGYGTNTYNSYTGNRLNSISGFTNSSYSYDANGNLLSDSQKGISLAYNELDLPQSVSGNQTISYVYDATGNKLSKSTAIGTRYYIDGIEYSGSSIEIIHTGEGIARRSGTAYSYEYNLSDHLGNVRVTFYKNPNTNQLEVLQRDNYYAFGLRKTPVVQAGTNKYLYNGKELQEELNEYDYGARFYNPVVGRWNVIDPLAEDYDDVSPYNYVLNNPVNFTDPDGTFVEGLPFGYRSTVVDPTGKIIKHVDDGDNSIYQIVDWKKYNKDPNTGKVKIGTEKEGIDYNKLIEQQINPLLYDPNPIQLNEVQIQKNTEANTFPLVLSPPSGTIGLPRIPPPHPILVFLAALISNSGLDAWTQGRRPGELHQQDELSQRILEMAHKPKKQSTGKSGRDRHDKQYTHGGKNRKVNPNQRKGAQERRNNGKRNN